MDLKEERKRARLSRDTRESIRGKHNYVPGEREQGGYWPSPQVHDLPGSAPREDAFNERYDFPRE